MNYDQEARSIEQICNEESANKGFSIELLGNVYCSLSINKRIDCVYCSYDKDKNKLYTCNNPIYQSLRLENKTKH